MSADTLNVPPKNRDTKGGLFKWAGNDHNASKRRKLYNILFQAKSVRSYIRTLNIIWDKDSLAVALNDTPEAYRIQVLRQLQTGNRRTYKDIASRLSKLQEAVYKNKLDLTFLYPRIATKNFMATLPYKVQ
jgi:O6-methylguanine-DNA--protein-cysteine methyltransferase